MGTLENVLAHVVWIGLFAGGFVAPALPVSAQQAGATSQRSTMADTATNGQGPANPQDLPDSPGATLAQAQAPALPEGSQAQSAPTQGEQNQATPQKPVGTAAAEAPNTSGIAASEPAGVAIAPAKQRRARTIIIRTGAIIGAAVAIGVVVGLTEVTSSKPPGAH
jgi:hypothetical protein